jgi:hypothetical protein
MMAFLVSIHSHLGQARRLRNAAWLNTPSNAGATPAKTPIAMRNI